MMKQSVIDAKNKLVEECRKMGLSFAQQVRIEELAYSIVQANKEEKGAEEEDSILVSSCCAAEIIDTDICFECREHCDSI